MRIHLVAIFAVGCSGTNIKLIQLNPLPHRTVPKPAAAVEVYSSGPPTRAHVDVAVMNAETAWDSPEEMFAHLRYTAGANGCDGIVIDHVKQSERTLASMTATCIVYRHSGPAAVVTPSAR